MITNLTEVDGIPIKSQHKAICHCGAVQLEIDFPEGLIDLRRCDCSLCRRKGAIMTSAGLSALRILKGHDSLKMYQFNTKTAKHYFCGICGIYTHHQSRSDPNRFGINVGCLEGINPLKIKAIPTFDGVNHPSDAT